MDTVKDIIKMSSDCSGSGDVTPSGGHFVGLLLLRNNGCKLQMKLISLFFDTQILVRNAFCGISTDDKRGLCEDVLRLNSKQVFTLLCSHKLDH